MVQKQSLPHKKAIKVPSRNLKVKLDYWCKLNRLWIISLIIIVSVLLRIVYFEQLRQTHFINQHIFPESDMFVFDEWATTISKGDILSKTYVQPKHVWMQEIADRYFQDYPDKLAALKASSGSDTTKSSLDTKLWTHWYGKNVFPHEPLYAYFLALNYTLFGHNVIWVFIWQLILGVLTNLLVYLVARRYFGDLTGVIAASLVIFCGPVMFYELVLLRSSMGVFLGILVVYLVGTAILKNTFTGWLISGLVCGLAVMVHTFFILFVFSWIILMVLLFRKKSRVLLVSSMGFILGTLLALSPVMIRNSIMDVPLLSMSNNSAIGFITMNEVKFKSFMGWGLDTKTVADIMEQSDGHLLKTIIPTLKTHPSIGSYLLQLWNKLHATFSWYEISNNVNFYFYREFAAVLFLTFISFLFISPLALVGMFLAIYKKINAAPLYLMFLVFMFPMLAFMVLSRYRIILAVILIPFAALTITEILGSWRRWKNYIIIIFLCILGYWASTPGTDTVHKIKKDDYSLMLTIHYGDAIGKAIDDKKWGSIVNILKDFLSRYEPEKVRKVKPFYRCHEPVEAAVFVYFADMHRNLAHAHELAGDLMTASVERDIAQKLKLVSNR